MPSGRASGPTSFAEFGALAGHLRCAERALRASSRARRSTRWAAGRPELEHKQAFLGRIVDIGAELFAIAATCTYAQTLARERPERAEAAFELADLFCRQARRRTDRLFDALWHNDDSDRYAAAQKLLHGRYDWFTADVLDPAGDGPMLPDARARRQHSSR